jgi:hypothetical protein
MKQFVLLCGVASKTPNYDGEAEWQSTAFNGDETNYKNLNLHTVPQDVCSYGGASRRGGTAEALHRQAASACLCQWKRSVY